MCGKAKETGGMKQMECHKRILMMMMIRRTAELLVIIVD